MSDLKTKVSNASVEDFINNLSDEEQRKDSFELVKIFEEVTKEEAKMWGPAIIGFGKYTYTTGSSKKENEMPLAAFSPRKQNLTLYVMPSWGNLDEMLEQLGKHKTSKGCLYIDRLRDVDLAVLKEIIRVSFEEAKRRYDR